MSTISIGTQPTDESKLEGQSVTLSIVATPQNDPDFGADGILTYQWERRNKRTGEFVPILGATDTSLTISSLSASDDNDYRCIVKNTYQSALHLDESLVRTSYGSESVLVDDEYHIGYRSFTLRTEPSDIYTIYPQSESIDISDITAGQIAKLKITESGEGYTPGTYTGVSLTDGSGSGATADIVVADIKTRTLLKSQGSDYADGFYPDTPLMNDKVASGSGARADLLITEGKLRKVMITSSGSSYALNDLLLLERSIQSITIANPAVLTCENHGLTTGDTVKISRVGGMTAINGESTTITVLTSDTFELVGVDSTGAGYGTPKTISTITRANPAVVTCTAHGFSNGDTVTFGTIVGMTALSGLSGTVSSSAANSFSVNIDTSNTSVFGSFVSGSVKAPATPNTGYVSVIGTTGNNAELEIVSLAKSGVQSITSVDVGENYTTGDILSAASGDIGGGSDFEVEVSSINTKITTATDHNLSVSDVVGIDNVTGMTEINQLFGTIIQVPTSSTMLLNINSSDFTSYTSGGYVQPQITKTVSLGTVNPLYITSNPS